MARNLSVDDLLKELDDLPNAGVKKGSSTSAASTPSAASAKASSALPDGARGPFLQPHAPATSAPRSTARQSSISNSTTPIVQQQPRRDTEPLHQRRHTHSANSKHKSALDELLDNFDDLDVGSASAAPKNAPPARSNPGNSAQFPTSAAPKCMGLFIGGSRKHRGRNGSCVGTVVCCDNLRCTKCDFKVIWFHDKCWDDSVDYLFFRNNFPTETKLSPKLVSMSGSCAYCCQCSWQSTVKELLVDYGGDLRWVCGGHSLE